MIGLTGAVGSFNTPLFGRYLGLSHLPGSYEPFQSSFIGAMEERKLAAAGTQAGFVLGANSWRSGLAQRGLAQASGQAPVAPLSEAPNHLSFIQQKTEAKSAMLEEDEMVKVDDSS